MTPEQMASGLISALDEVLDLDTGLADARLPDLRSTLVHDLTDVLDLDAGLANIQPPPAAISGQVRGTAGLVGFAVRFRELPADERLAARKWFPLEGLRILRSLSLARLNARAIGDDFDHGVQVTRARVRTVVDRVHLIREAANSIRRQLHYPPHSDPFDVDLARALDTARQLVLARHGPRARFLARGIEGNLGTALLDMFGIVRLLAKQRADESEAGLADVLLQAFDTQVVANSNFGDRLMIISVDRMKDSLSNVMAADLSQVDLSGIPLEGLRWSPTTSWPSAWWEQIRDNSVEIKPGVYEVRFGGISADLIG